jgi:DNA-directed RNA polymerase subunit RPC12/RpoP
MTFCRFYWQWCKIGKFSLLGLANFEVLPIIPHGLFDKPRDRRPRPPFLICFASSYNANSLRTGDALQSKGRSPQPNRRLNMAVTTKPVKGELVLSHPTMCLHCHLIVEMFHERGADPVKGSWQCPRCGHKYLFSHWKIKKQVRGKTEAA